MTTITQIFQQSYMPCHTSPMPYNQILKNEVNNSRSDLIKGNQHTMHPTLDEVAPRKYLHSEIQKIEHNEVNTSEVTLKSKHSQNACLLT